MLKQARISTYEVSGWKEQVLYKEDYHAPSKWLLLLTLHTEKIWVSWLLFVSYIQCIYVIQLSMCPTLDYNSDFGIKIGFLVMGAQIMYTIDVLLTILTQYLWKPKHPELSHVYRPIWIIVFEVISIIPFNMLLSPTMKSNKYYTVSLTQTFKLARLVYHFRISNKRYESIVIESWIKLVGIQIINICFLASGIKELMCFRGYCTRDVNFKAFDFTTTQIIGKSGLSKYAYMDNIYIYELPLIFLKTYVHLIFIYPTTTWLVLVYICQYKHRFNFAFMIAFFKKCIAKNYIKHHSLYNRIMDIFEARWNIRGGYTEDQEVNYKNANSFLLRIDIAMEIRSPLFLHCIIFSEIDIETLRYIAPLVQRIVFSAGEYIYRKDVIKDSMYYIVSGVVDIISYENAESPILSLTSGTCIGTANLIIPNKSIVDFKCKGNVEVLALQRKDFATNARRFIHGYNYVRERVMARYQKSKKLQSKVHGKKNVYHLKNMLHTMMSKTAKLKKEHKITNIYLREIANESKNRLATTEYLSGLSVHVRTEADVDLVFYKQTCLWILKPSSPVLILWDHMIRILSVCAAILIPYSWVKMNEYTASCLNIIYVAWLADFIRTIITIPIDNKTDATTVIKIIAAKMHTNVFILDLLCIMPVGYLKAVFSTDTQYGEAIRMLKLYMVFRGIKRSKSKFSVNILFKTAFKFFSIYMLWVYIASAILSVSNRDNGVGMPHYVQMMTAIGFDFKYFTPQITMVYNVLNAVAVALEVLVMAKVISALFLNDITLESSERYINHIKKIIYKRFISTDVTERMESYFNTQLIAYGGITVKISTKEILKMRDRHNIILNSQFHFKELSKLQLFKGIPEEVVRALAGTANCLIFHKFGIIIDRGFVEEDSVFVLVSGKTRSIVGTSIYSTPPDSVLNLLEAAFKTPCVATISGLTQVMIITFSFRKFLDLLKEYPEHFSRFQNVIKTNKYIHDELWKILHGVRVLLIRDVRDQHTNIVKFNRQAPWGSFSAYDYHVPFDNLGIYHYIKYLLMQRTFNPQGIFWKRWEYSRCVFAILSSIFFAIIPISISDIKSVTFWLLQLLDIPGYIDIYLRLHLCYNNNDGLLVRHPLRTAAYYLKHSFIIDLISVIPYNLIFCDFKPLRAILNLTRLTQIYRLVGLKKVTPLNYFMSTLYYTILLFLIHITVSSMVFITVCYPKLDDCFITKAGGNYFSVLYIVSSIGLGSGIGSPMNAAFLYRFRIPMMIATLPLYFVRVVFFSMLFMTYLPLNSERTFYRRGLMLLLNFMKNHKMHQQLRVEALKYYNNYWMWMGDSNLFIMIQHLNRALRNELFFAFYGNHLVETSIFDVPVYHLNEFYKNILLKFQPLILHRGASALSINDVHSHIYFIYIGSMEVVGPDGATMVHLNDGAIFGNLENCHEARQKVSIIANNQVKLFRMQTHIFYQIMSFFPAIKLEFHKHRRINLYYIESRNRDKYKAIKLSDTEMTMYKMYGLFSKFHAIVICFVAVIWDFANVGMGYSLYTMIAFDVLHLIHHVLKYFVYLKDENRDFIKGRHKMFQYHTNIYLKFTIATLSIIPFNIIGLEYHFNRYIRLYYYFKFCFKKLNVLSNGSIMIYRVSFLFSQIVIFHSAFAYLLGPNFIQVLEHTPKGKYLERLKVYLKYYYFASIMLWSYNDKNYTPKDHNASIVVMIGFYISFIVTVIIFNQFYGIVRDCTDNYINFYDTVQYYKYFFSVHKLSPILQTRIKNSYTRIWRRMNEGLELLEYNSPQYIRDAFYNNLVSQLFTDHPVFRNAHVDFLRQLYQHVTVNMYYNERWIIRKYDVRACMYIILSGTVVVFNNEHLALQVLTEGDSFGIEQGLNYHVKFQYTYKATGTCEVVELELDKWEYLLKFFPASKEAIYKSAEDFYDEAACLTLKDKRKKEKTKSYL